MRPIEEAPESGEIVVDASGHVAGRLATQVAALLVGRPRLRVHLVNADAAAVVGDPQAVLRRYGNRVSLWRTHYNPEKTGPKVPRRPDRILKRMVRGMLPKGAAGRAALKRLRVYMAVPPQLAGRERYYVPEALLRQRPFLRHITLGELWRRLDPQAWERWNRARELWRSRLAAP